MAVFIDTRTNDLVSSAVLVTRTAQGLIMRFVADLGPLEELVKEEYYSNEPIIIPDYSFYSPLDEMTKLFAGSDHLRKWVVGIDHGRGRGLQQDPLLVAVLRPGLRVEEVKWLASGRSRPGVNHAVAPLEARTMPVYGIAAAYILQSSRKGTRVWEFHTLYDKDWEPSFPNEGGEE